MGGTYSPSTISILISVATLVVIATSDFGTPAANVKPEGATLAFLGDRVGTRAGVAAGGDLLPFAAAARVCGAMRPMFCGRTAQCVCVNADALQSAAQTDRCGAGAA